MVSAGELAQHERVEPVGLSARDPVRVAVTPDGKTLFVTNKSDFVTPVTVATNTPGTPIPVGSNPIGVAVTPDGRTAYVADAVSYQVTPINVATKTAGTPIPTNPGTGGPLDVASGRRPCWAARCSSRITPIAPTPSRRSTSLPTSPGRRSRPARCRTESRSPRDRKTAYVSDFFHTVTPVDVATNTPGPPITVGPANSQPYGVVVTPDGRTVYVSNKNVVPGTVTPISVATNTAGTPITVGNNPKSMAVTPDGRTVYVANGANASVTPINVTTNTAGTPIPVGNSPSGVAVTADGKTVYVSNSGDITVTPITVATNTPGPRSRSATARSGSRSRPTWRSVHRRWRSGWSASRMRSSKRGPVHLTLGVQLAAIHGTRSRIASDRRPD